jgi:hypothetical protein
MADETYHEFDDQAVTEAISAARTSHLESTGATETAAPEAPANLTDSGALEIAAQCITITVANRKVCVRLPLGIGNVCLPVPAFVPNGQAAQACISICTKFGIPTGVKITVSVGSNTILRKTFGIC